MSAKSTDLRTLKTQRAVHDALISLMTEKDISKITVSELAAKAMINRKTFYRHYNCINDVLEEIESVIVDGVSNILKQEHSMIIDPHTLFHGISNLMNENREFYSAILKVKSSDFIVGKIRDAVRDALLNILREIGSADEATLSACAEFAVSGILALYSKWFIEGEQGSLDDLADVACRMMLDGISGTVGINPAKLLR